MIPALVVNPPASGQAPEVSSRIEISFRDAGLSVTAADLSRPPAPKND